MVLDKMSWILELLQYLYYLSFPWVINIHIIKWNTVLTVYTLELAETVLFHFVHANIQGNDNKVNLINGVHPLGTLNICTKFHGNPANSCQDTSIKIKNVNLLIPLEKKSVITKVTRVHPLGTTNICPHFYRTQSYSCWDIRVWTKTLDRPTNQQTTSKDKKS